MVVAMQMTTERGVSHAVRCVAQVDESGAELAASQRTLLWVHPLYGAMTTDDEEPWNFWTGDATRHANIIRCDMRGHGGSDDCVDPALMTWEAFAEDQHALLDHMRVTRKVVVGGASMGAGSALWFATTQPQRVMGLIMVIPPTCYETRQARAGGLMKAAQQGFDQFVEKRTAGAPRVLSSTAVRPPPGVRKASYAAVCEGSARANFPPRSAVTAAVTMPVLVLGWDCGDTIHPPSSVHELKALIPHAQTYVATTVEEVAAWPTLIAGFLARLPTATD